ncbi:polysaccharide biosynthesis protein [Pseudoflavonifractor sp. An85]|uniref:putative polysaccharide biosynthesis protein n=1 Tax=Pseudoflavonifractor sp. An85 TaxID=1965661 RepID=UPI000B3AEF99|nr:polysaccharide biosynthesis protein [Pseudoflavonifractor sp. An85]OUN24360.1 hypothetical protein B5G37_07835 [Pseudoflavonifractor sp. An85]
MSNPTSKKNTFFGGAAVLAAGIVIVKLIGALYKIPLGNILGEAGFSDFNTAYYIYSLLITVSTGGLPVALSKMISEAHALGRHNQVQKIFRVAFLTFFVLGTISFCLMFFFPKQLAGLMNNAQSWYSIRALAPAIFFLCPLSAMRGYFQGHAIMTPTAVSQIIEALCKLVIGLALATFLLKSSNNESVAAAGAIFGVSVGCALGMLYTAFCFRTQRQHAPVGHDRTTSSKKIFRTLLQLAIPITLGSSVIGLVNLIDTSMIYGRLQDAAGFSELDARSLKGVYDQALTLYNLPSSFMVPLTASIIPAVSAAQAVKNRKLGAQISETALRTTALLAIPAGVGLFVLSQPIMQLLYPSTDVELGGYILSILGLAVIFVCFMLVCNAIMQAHHLVTIPMVTTIIGCIFKLPINYVLVGNRGINIKGAPVSTLFCFGLIAVMDLIIIKRTLPRSLSLMRAFGKPLATSLIMGLAVWACYGLTSSFLTTPQGLSNSANAMATLLSVGVGGVVYLVLVVVLQAISPEDLKFMPKGDKIARLLRMG